MAHETRAEGPDVDALSRREDPDGRPAFLTVCADLTTGDWESRLKEQAETIRNDIGDEMAAKVKFHQAFDEAFIEVDRLSRTDAKGAVVFVSPLHHLQETVALREPVETGMELESAPQTDRLRDAKRR